MIRPTRIIRRPAHSIELGTKPQAVIAGDDDGRAVSYPSPLDLGNEMPCLGIEELCDSARHILRTARRSALLHRPRIVTDRGRNHNEAALPLRASGIDLGKRGIERRVLTLRH